MSEKEHAMKAIAIDDFGTQPTLHDLPVPEPGKGEVLVRVRASSVNGFDVAVAAGCAKGIMEHHFPAVLGKDFAGTVEGTGWGAMPWGLGIWGFRVERRGSWVLVTMGSSRVQACRRPACRAGWRPVPRTGRAVLQGQVWCFSWSGGRVADGDDGLGGAGGGVAAGAGECGAGLGLAGAVPVPVGDGAGHLDGGGPGGELLPYQVRGLRAEHRPSGRPGTADGGFRFPQRGL